MPQIKLSEKFIERIAVEGPTEYSDTQMPGLVLKVTPSGYKTWLVRTSVNGKAFRPPSPGRHPSSRGGGDLGLAAARLKVTELVLAERKGESLEPVLGRLVLKPGEHLTVEKLGEMFLELHSRPKKSAISSKEDERILRKYVYPALGKLPARAVESHHVYDVLDEIAKRAPAQADAVRRLLSKVWNWALKHLSPRRPGPWREIKYNPIANVDRLWDPVVRQRFLQAGEIRILWQIWDADLKRACAFHLLSDHGDPCLAQWQELDLEAGRWGEKKLPFAAAEAARDWRAVAPLEQERVFSHPGYPDRAIHPNMISLSGGIFALLLLQGQRTGQTLQMTWRDIDLEEREWWVPVGKGRPRHQIALSGMACEVLRRIEPVTRSQNFVFPGRCAGAPVTSINVAYRRYRKLSGIDDWTPHSLRKTVGTTMSKLGISAETRAVLLNHATRRPGVTEGYYDVSDLWASTYPQVRQAIDLYGAHIEGLVSGAGKVLAFRQG